MATYQSSNGFRTGSKTPVSILQELLLRNNIVPQYELIHNGVGTHEPQFRYKLQAGGFTAIGCGKSKKEAKHDAARSILKRMHFNKALTESAHVEPAEDIDIESPYSGAVKENLVGQLTDLCVINNLPQPEYIPVREEGPPHARIFTYECLVSTRSETAIARTKKQAKHMVSQQMINRLTDILGDIMVQVPEKIGDPDTDEGYEPDGTPLLMLEGVKRNQLNLGLPISQYHNVISDTANTEPIPILEDLKDKSLSWINSHPSPEILLEELASQLKAKLEINLVGNASSDVTDDVNSINSTDEPIENEKTNENPQDNRQHNDETELKSDSDSYERRSSVVITIDSSPQRVFFGSAKSFTEAVRNAAVSALNFYFFMAQPLNQEFDWKNKTEY